MLAGGKLTVGWGRRCGTRDALEDGIREFNSLPLRENHSCQASQSALRLFCTT